MSVCFPLPGVFDQVEVYVAGFVIIWSSFYETIQFKRSRLWKNEVISSWKLKIYKIYVFLGAFSNTSWINSIFNVIFIWIVQCFASENTSFKLTDFCCQKAILWIVFTKCCFPKKIPWKICWLHLVIWGTCSLLLGFHMVSLSLLLCTRAQQAMPSNLVLRLLLLLVIIAWV